MGGRNSVAFTRPTESYRDFREFCATNVLMEVCINCRHFVTAMESREAFVKLKILDVVVSFRGDRSCLFTDIESLGMVIKGKI